MEFAISTATPAERQRRAGAATDDGVRRHLCRRVRSFDEVTTEKNGPGSRVSPAPPFLTSLTRANRGESRGFLTFTSRAPAAPWASPPDQRVTHFDRVEWLTLDTFSAMAALHAGEIDWWELPPSDLLEQLARDRDLTVISQYATAMGLLRFNHLHPPFDNVAARQALLGAVDQVEAMTAVAGTDRTFWHDGIGLFGAGTPLANDTGIDILRGPREHAAVRRALARAGYNGETIVALAPTDVQPIRALSLAGAEQLRRAGVSVDLQEVTLGTEIIRWQSQAAPNKGGWNVFFILMDRSRPNTNPYGNPWIRADGLAAFPGWPTSPRIEALRAAWLDAGSLDEQRRICTELQMQLWQDVPYIPMGEYWQSTAYRKDLLDVMPGCFAVFYGVRRT